MFVRILFSVMELYGSEVPLIPPSPTDEPDGKNDLRPEKAAPVGEFEKVGFVWLVNL